MGLAQCPHCSSAATKQNGHAPNGKQNRTCRDCGRQFLEDGQSWFVRAEARVLIHKLLPERISLAGICRVCGVSESWLLGYTRALYAQLPDGLNATAEIPDMEGHLAAHMGGEIGRIGVLKKFNSTSTLHANSRG